MLEIKDLTVGFNIGLPTERIVLNHFNLNINDGDFVVILGSNGCGKTTLFNSILGENEYNGNIILNGKSLEKMSDFKRASLIGVVYQDPLKGTAPNLRVFDNILLSAKKKSFLGFKKECRNNAIKTLTEYGLGLENHLDSKAIQLSGGQRQALTLYMATNSNPSLLLLDEHTAALDPSTQEKIMEITDRIVNEKKMITLMVTHNLKSALKYGNRLLVLKHGEVFLDINGEEKDKMTEDTLLTLYKDNLLASQVL